MNDKKLRRLYAEERLQVRRRSGRERAVGTRAPLALPSGPNQGWSLDFVSDAVGDGRRFRILAVVDDFTPEFPIRRAKGAGCGRAPFCSSPSIWSSPISAPPSTKHAAPSP